MSSKYCFYFDWAVLNKHDKKKGNFTVTLTAAVSYIFKHAVTHCINATSGTDFLAQLLKTRCDINRPLSLRGHVTNASFKQSVGILLMPKLTELIKLSCTQNLRGNGFKRDILWHFYFSTLAAMLEGTLLPLNIAAKTTFCLYIVKRLIVTLRRADVTTLSSQHFPRSLGAKFVFRKRQFITLKITVWSRDQLQTYPF